MLGTVNNDGTVKGDYSSVFTRPYYQNYLDSPVTMRGIPDITEVADLATV